MLPLRLDMKTPATENALSLGTDISSGKRTISPIDLPGGQINDPSLGKHYSLPFLPATPSSPYRTLGSPRALLPELQRYKDTVRCAALGAEVPGHHQQHLTSGYQKS